MSHPILAIDGGEPLRSSPLPSRRLFAEEELESVKQVFEESWSSGLDFGYQGKFEEAYTRTFCEFQGGGYADAVSTGTAAILLTLAALNLPPKSEVVLSPVTDPGGVTPVLFLGLIPIVADSATGSFNMGSDEFRSVISERTRAVIVTHVGGIPADMDPIMEVAASHGIRVVEDCSQAHGALYKGQRVGRFGDIAAFSTMFSKNHASGGCGGLVYTRNEALYRAARCWADRGKPFYETDFNPKDPTGHLFAALNFNQDELSCAIGLSTLKKLQKTIEKRISIIKRLDEGLCTSRVVRPVSVPDHAIRSPFFHTILVDREKLKVSKIEFAQAIAAEGVWINSDYRFVVSEWPWMYAYFPRKMSTPHAADFKNNSFNVLFNEQFENCDVDDIVDCILKVEKALCS